MLFSGNKAARFVLLREGVALLLIPFDVLFLIFERRFLKKASQRSEPLILILGGSRSGTTLLYQTLAAYLPVSYINNFYASFHRSPITAFKLFHRIFRRSKKSFKSYYGSVAGFAGPNDAFSLWNRWLGTDRNHIDDQMDEKAKSEMKRFFNAWHGVSKKPFLNKNNRNSLCAPLFDSIFENIYFVEIHRDPIYVAQSLVLSRRAVQGSEKIGWGLLSKDSDDNDDPLAYIDDICNQVYQVDELLAKGRSEIDPNRYFRISYENFCRNPGEVVQHISVMALNQNNSSKELVNLSFSTAANRQRLGDKEFEHICLCIKKLYGKH